MSRVKGSLSDRFILDRTPKCSRSVTSASTGSTHSSFSSLVENITARKAKPSVAYGVVHPEKICMTPGPADNFYLNVLDWSSNQLVAFAYDQEVYLTTLEKDPSQAPRSRQSVVTALRFHPQATLLYLGEETGRMEIYDTVKGRTVRSVKRHCLRIGKIEAVCGWTLLTGSKDGCIGLNDIRVPKMGIGQLLGHKGEVCGLAGRNGQVASGSNDNRVILWDLRRWSQVSSHAHHRGAVKALKWCPWRINLLASGGGARDHKVVFWNTEDNSTELELDLKTQVTSLHWRQKTRQIVSSHSGAENGYVIVWDPKTRKVSHKLIGHRRRVLQVAINPHCEDELVTLGADELVCTWRLPSHRKYCGAELMDLVL